MSYEQNFPVAVVDVELDPHVVVTRWQTVEQAESFIKYLHAHGGKVTARKVERGGYGIESQATVSEEEP